MKSLFNYCPLVWILCYRRIMHKMNKIHERYLRLLTGVYKYIHVLSPGTMNDVFCTRANIYNTRQFNVVETHIPTSNRYGLNLIPYKANHLWNLLPENLKSSPSLSIFKNEIKFWQCFNCSCNICKSPKCSERRLLRFTQLIFLLHSRQFLTLV